MRENRLRTLWREDKAAVNGWLAVPNSFSAEVMAHQGWDSLTIDMQHGVIDYQAMVGMLQAISTTPTVPVVRVPWLEPGIIMKTLDAGAYAIIRGELEAYGAGLADKTEIVALNKIDALTSEARDEKAAQLQAACGRRPMLVSGVSGEGVTELLRAAWTEVRRMRGETAPSEDETPAETPGGWTP